MLKLLSFAFPVLLSLAACGDNLDEHSAIRAEAERTLGTALATGYSVAVWKDGQIVYSEAFGTRDERGTPVSPHTLFQIGSDTKKITAIALLQEVQAGHASLDDNVNDVLPDLSLAAAPDQLSHTVLGCGTTRRGSTRRMTPPWRMCCMGGSLRTNTR